MSSPVDMSPNRPYLVRALYEWIVDNSMTPHLLVDAEMDAVEVPAALVQNGKIILNVSPRAVQNLEIGKEWLTMDARFSGKAQHILIPVAAVIAVYAKENGQGMMFADEANTPPGKPDGSNPGASTVDIKTRNSHLKIVK